MHTILSFMLSRKMINIYNNIAWKYGNVPVKDFRKLTTKKKKKTKIRHPLSQQLANNIFKLPNVSNKDAL